MPIRTLIILILAAAALAGCGRRGALEPPTAEPVAEAEADLLSGPMPSDGVSPLDPGSRTDPYRVGTTPPPPPVAEPPPTAPRRFLLDFLL